MYDFLTELSSALLRNKCIGHFSPALIFFIQRYISTFHLPAEIYFHWRKTLAQKTFLSDLENLIYELARPPLSSEFQFDLRSQICRVAAITGNLTLFTRSIPSLPARDYHEYRRVGMINR